MTKNASIGHSNSIINMAKPVTTAGDVTSTEPEKNLVALNPAESVESEEEAAGTTYVSQRRKRLKRTS
jgi:hypothetical protein